MVDVAKLAIRAGFRPPVDGLPDALVAAPLVETFRGFVDLLDRQQRCSQTCFTHSSLRLFHERRTEALVAESAQDLQVRDDTNRPRAPCLEIHKNMADRKAPAGAGDEKDRAPHIDRGSENALHIAAPGGERPEIGRGRLADLDLDRKTM